ERVAGEADARPHTDVEVELLPHGHDGAVVDIPFALESRLELGLGSFVRFRSNRAKETELVLGQQVDSAVGQSVAFVAPALPADVGVDIVGVEADGFEDAQSLGKNLIADAVSRHGDYGVLGHMSS